MTKNITEKHRYTLLDGKLCIQHYLLLQQLTYRKKLKDNSYKKYHSYHIKFPKAIKDLLGTDIVYLEKVENTLILHTGYDDDFKKIKIQETRKGKDDVGYQLTIPRKLLDIGSYRRGESYVLCQVLAADNNEGFIVSLKLS